MSIKTKTLNVHADSPDLRDRIYSPTLRLLGKTYNAEPFADEAWASRIKDQGQTPPNNGLILPGNNRCDCGLRLALTANG